MSIFDEAFTVDQSDDRIQNLLCRWADDRYGTRHGKAEQVQIEFHEGYGGGCDTCGYGADVDTLTVLVSYSGSLTQEHDESYSTGLINDILRFATT